MTQIITVSLDAYDPSVPGVVTLRYATQSYTTSPTDTPANTHFEGRIQQPGNFRRECFANAKTYGQTQIGYGELVLANIDGALDSLINYSFAGRTVTIRIGTVTPNSAGIPVWTTVLVGTMEQAQLSWQRVTIRIRDRQQDLAKPLQQTRYAGSNALPAGIEGTANDIGGRAKPLIFGQVFNIAPPCINTSRFIYQVHAGSALQSVDAVYERGAALTAGTAYASQADMEATAPTAGQYRVWNSAVGAFIRLAGASSGEITVDATQGATAASRTAGQLFNAILLKAGVSAGNISSADIAALDSAAPYPIGVYASHDEDISALQLLDQVCGSVGAWYGPDSLGVFRVARIELPTGASVASLSATDVTRIERAASRDAGVGVPAWKVKLNYKKIYRAQTDLASTVSADRKEFLTSEFRRAESSDSSVLTANLTSPEIEFDTYLVNAADAATEVARRLTIYKARRDVIEISIRVDADVAASLDLGKIVTLQLNRYGMSAGKKFLIVGIRTDLGGNLFDLTLWG